MAARSNDGASVARESSPTRQSRSSSAPTTTGAVAAAVPGTDSPNSVTINFSGPSNGNNIQVLVGVNNASGVHGPAPSAQAIPQPRSRWDDQGSPLQTTSRDASPEESSPRFDDRVPRREVTPDMEKTVNEVCDVAFNAATEGDSGPTIQHPFPQEPISGMTLWDPQMDEPVRERHRSDYKVGQICMTYVLEPSSDPNLKMERGAAAVRTSVGLMAGKWRPAIVMDVFESHCVVAEMGRRSGRVFEGLSLEGLLERCGVITKVDSGKYDPLNERDELFRSIYEPLRVDYYYGGCRPLGQDSAVQFCRVNSKSFDSTCSPIGELTEESTRRLLDLPSLSKHLKQKAAREHTAYHMSKRIDELPPRPDYELTPRRGHYDWRDYDYHGAIVSLKKTAADVLGSSNEDNDEQHDGNNDDLYAAPESNARAGASTTAQMANEPSASRDDLKRKRDSSSPGGANKRPVNAE